MPFREGSIPNSEINALSLSPRGRGGRFMVVTEKKKLTLENNILILLLDLV